MDPENTRHEYTRGKLEEAKLPDDPLELFSRWLEEARASGQPEPEAMALSTVERNGQPSSRIVLLKKIQDGWLIFFTNYQSRKAMAMRIHNRVAALFFWPGLERQVKITGIAKTLEDEDSDRYFRTRPLESQLGAWASPQSEEIPDRKCLEEEIERYRKKFANMEHVPRPAHWGGIAILPNRIEFWQGRPARLNDRFEFTRTEKGWRRARLAP